MDNIYIVSYDLSDPGQRYDELISKIKESSAWAKLGGSSYLLKSNKEPTTLRDYDQQSLDSTDKLYIGKVSAPAAWCGMPQDVSDWIRKQLKPKK